MMRTAARSEKLDLRHSASDKQTLQTAAVAARRSMNEFVLESALARAEETLPDRRAFGLDASAWADFQAALEAPVRTAPRMAKLLHEPSILE